MHSSIVTRTVGNEATRTRTGMDDIAIITISTNESQWLRPCLSTVFAHIGDVSADVVVVDNDSTTRRPSSLPRSFRALAWCGRETSASGTRTTAG